MNRRQFLAASPAFAAGAGLGALGKADRRWRDAAHGTAHERTWGPNEAVRVACVGVRSRGRDHMHGLESVPGASVVALCDVDRAVLYARAAELEGRTGRKIKTFVDFRQLLDDSQIDAISIATPNHTHAPVALAAMEAGKDVYVEKPCSHNVRQGRQLAAAARKHRRICQHGTQGRCSPAVREAIEQLRGGLIGRVDAARAVSFCWRPALGQMPDEPVPNGVEYGLWLGPAPVRPFSRSRFHDSWRWHWDYGGGDLGNQGVHPIDLARWGLGVGLPGAVRAAGGQFMFDDLPPIGRGGLIVVFDYPADQKRIVFQTRPGPIRPSVTFYGSEGRMKVSLHGYETFLGRRGDPGPRGRGAPNQYERFIAAVRSRRREDLAADIEQGHLSSALCHLGNIAYRLGRAARFDPETETFPGDEEATAMLG